MSYYKKWPVKVKFLNGYYTLIQVSLLVMSSFMLQNCGPYEQVSLYFLHLSSFHFRSLILNEGGRHGAVNTSIGFSASGVALIKPLPLLTMHDNHMLSLSVS